MACQERGWGSPLGGIGRNWEEVEHSAAMSLVCFLNKLGPATANHQPPKMLDLQRPHAGKKMQNNKNSKKRRGANIESTQQCWSGVVQRQSRVNHGRREEQCVHCVHCVEALLEGERETRRGKKKRCQAKRRVKPRMKEDGAIIGGEE